MPAIMWWFVGGLAQAASTLVGKVLLSLGIGYAVFTGIDTTITAYRADLVAGITGLPAVAVGIAATLKIGVCISMLISALTTRLLIQGLTGGSITRMVQK